MAVQKENKSNFLILALIGAVCLSIPIVYLVFNQTTPEAENEIVGADGKVRADYDPGVAWLQSKPIMVPDGVGGINNLRATMRMKNRESAKTVCDRHPHLADTILKILTANKELMNDALEGSAVASQEIHMAISERLGTDLFTKTVLADTDLGLMQDDDKVRYECNSNGLNLVFKDPPKGLKQ